MHTSLRSYKRDDFLTFGRVSVPARVHRDLCHESFDHVGCRRRPVHRVHAAGLGHFYSHYTSVALTCLYRSVGSRVLVERDGGLVGYSPCGGLVEDLMPNLGDFSPEMFVEHVPCH